MNLAYRESIYQEAKRRGIKLRLGTIERLHKKGWSKEEILAFKDKRTFTERESYFIKVAEKNGINISTYRSRRRAGWSKEDASSLPVGKGFQENRSG